MLDVGAGTGRVALDLARRGHEVVALDRDAELLDALRERARAACRSTTVAADARDFASTGASRSMVVPMQTLQLLGGAEGRGRFLALRPRAPGARRAARRRAGRRAGGLRRGARPAPAARPARGRRRGLRQPPGRGARPRRPRRHRARPRDRRARRHPHASATTSSSSTASTPTSSPPRPPPSACAPSRRGASRQTIEYVGSTVAMLRG